VGVRLLFLSWAYPPMRYPRAIQVERLATHVRLRPLDIICLAPEGGAIQHSRTADGVAVTRLPRTPTTRLLERLLPPARRRALAQPDADRWWWKRAARYIESACRPGPDDALVTFGQPMADHRAGLAIKQRTGVRWIAHFSDPWADNPFVTDPAARARALVHERGVIEVADHLLFTSQETIDLVMAKYPAAWRAKASVLPHAFEPVPDADRTAPHGPVMLRYLGNFFGARSPAPLYRALNALGTTKPGLLDGIRVELIGEMPVDMQRHPDLFRLPPGTVGFVSQVDYPTSLSLMRSADLLLNIDAPFAASVFLPSKLVDYIGAGRPILGITPPGTASRLIGDLGGWVADPVNPEQIADALAEAVTFVASRRGQPWGAEIVRRRFDADTVAATFERRIATLGTGGSA
jgi:glycosyltransferase involved in cell wall biosynthesis